MKILSCCLVAFIFPLLGNDATYEEDFDGKVTYTEWVSSKDKIEGENDTYTIHINTPSEQNKSFEYVSKDEGYLYKITQEGPNLQAMRQDGDKEFQKQYRISRDPWIQGLEYGFVSFIHSKAKNFNFCIINPENLNLNKMVIKKKRLETIEIGGKKVEALKAVMTLRGFYSLFWKAELWFDPTSGELLVYQANKGPNTPVLTLTRIQNHN